MEFLVVVCFVLEVDESSGMITPNFLESHLGPVPGPRDDAGL